MKKLMMAVLALALRRVKVKPESGSFTYTEYFCSTQFNYVLQCLFSRGSRYLSEVPKLLEFFGLLSVLTYIIAGFFVR